MASHPSHFRTDIQALRALAVALVVLDHAGVGLPGGFVGVDVFFVVSGFVVTGVLLRDLHDHGRPRFGHFVARRARRLAPAASVVTVVTATLGALLLSPLGTQQQAAATGGAATLGVGNVLLYLIDSDYFSDHGQTNPFLHTWSLGVEEQFSLLLPVLVLLALFIPGRRAHPVTVLATVLVVLSVVSFTACLLLSGASVVPGIASPTRFAFFAMPTRLWEFGVGAVLATVIGRVRLPRFHGAVTGVGLLCIATGAATISSATPFPGVAALVPVLGTLLVLVGGTRPPSGSALAVPRPLVHLGDVSYSLYLWHWPAIVFARRVFPDNTGAVVAAVAVSLLAAEASYRFVEQPFRRQDASGLWRALRGPFLGVAAAGTACAVLLVGSLAHWGDPEIATAAEQLTARPLGYHACLSTTPVSERDLGPCTWGAEHGRPMYLMGDSNAQQYTEAMVGASRSLGRRLVVATWGGCPFFDVGLVRPTAPTKGDECAHYAADGFAWLRDQPRGTVVMAASNEMLLNDADRFRRPDGTSARTPDEKATEWVRSASQRVRALRELGFEVVLVRTNPHFVEPDGTAWNPVSCANATLRSDPARCGPSVDQHELDRRQAVVHEAESRVASRTGIDRIDIEDTVCQRGVCDTAARGLWRYRDGVHITPAFSRRLAPLFAHAMATT